MSPRFIAISQALLVVLASSLVGVLAKDTLGRVPPITLAWVQMLAGLLVLGSYAFFIKKLRWPKHWNAQVWRHVIAIGICNFAITRLMFMLALERLPVITVFYLVNFVGIVTMLMSIAFLKEVPSNLQWLGAAIAIGGLNIFFPEVPPPTQLEGILFLAIGVAALAATNTVARHLFIVTKGQHSSTLISVIALLLGASPIILYGLITELPPPITELKDWAIAIAYGVVNIAITMTVWNHILRVLRSFEASTLAATGLIWAAILSAVLLNDEIHGYQILGMAFMLVGITLLQFRSEPGSPERIRSGEPGSA